MRGDAGRGARARHAQVRRALHGRALRPYGGGEGGGAAHVVRDEEAARTLLVSANGREARLWGGPRRGRAGRAQAWSRLGPGLAQAGAYGAPPRAGWTALLLFHAAAPLARRGRGAAPMRRAPAGARGEIGARSGRDRNELGARSGRDRGGAWRRGGWERRGADVVIVDAGARVVVVVRVEVEQVERAGVPDEAEGDELRRAQASSGGDQAEIRREEARSGGDQGQISGDQAR